VRSVRRHNVDLMEPVNRLMCGEKYVLVEMEPKTLAQADTIRNRAKYYARVRGLSVMSRTIHLSSMTILFMAVN
jgi:hypothetical protein